MHLTGVGSTDSGSVVTVSSGTWLALLKETLSRLSQSLGLDFQPVEREKVDGYWPRSEASLEWMSKASYAGQEHAPASEIELLLQKALDADPEYVPALMHLTGVLSAQGKQGEALSVLNRMIQGSRPQVHGLCMLGALHLEMKDVAAAASALRECAGREPLCPKRMAAEAVIKLENGEYRDAIALLHQAQQLEPADSTLIAVEALARAVAREEAEARLLHDRALGRAWNNRVTYRVLISVAGMLKDIEQVVSHFRKWHQLAVRQRADAHELKTAEGLLENLTFSDSSYSHAPKPRLYSPSALRDEWMRRLAEGERKWVPDSLGA
ncbi:hypothetical protein EG829_32070, partial [bacterium]|nr:hypothetical protein [bacterium]